MVAINKILTAVSDAVWGMPTVILIISVGVYFSFRTRLVQLRIADIFRCVKRNLFSSDGSRLGCISTALAATVGTGSVTGVATALTLGGPGGIFWLWVSGFFGMAVAYAEGILSIKYRDGKKGGIMYALRDGLKDPLAGMLYALFCMLASFGMGSMVQSNSAAEALYKEFSLDPVYCGAAVAAVALFCLFSSSEFAGRLCGVFLPLLTLGYIVAMLVLIIMNRSALPGVFSDIFGGAFGIRAVFGGTAGAAVRRAVSVGFRRGIFSNEAGLGTTAAIHAESGCRTPCEQGLMNIFELIVDTFVICSLTAVGILSSGVELLGGADGAQLVTTAFGRVYGGLAGKLAAVSIAGFGIATVIGWSRIGLAAADYALRGKKPLITAYKLLYALSAYFGAVMSLERVWLVSDIFNGLMVFPCTFALIKLRKEILSEAHSLPVEPKPPMPRSDSGSSCASSISGKITGVTTSCANLSPGSKV